MFIAFKVNVVDIAKKNLKMVTEKTHKCVSAENQKKYFNAKTKQFI